VRYDDEVGEKLRQRSGTIELMRRSIDEHRFQVWYQPVYCCHHDLFCSAEALLRLFDDEGKPIPPDVFIPLAEENGMIKELTWIVLDDVCRLLSSDTVPGLESVSLNLSMQQLLDTGLAGRIQEYLERYGVAPERIKVEITERFILHDARYANEQLAALAAVGVQIFMDDFGTGYSNLSSVLHFPFTAVKLDRSLIAPVLENQQASLMVNTLLNLFHEIGKRVVAEGVEQAEQAERLRACGVDMIQGFYYAKPMPEKELIEFFEERNR